MEKIIITDPLVWYVERFPININIKCVKVSNSTRLLKDMIVIQDVYMILSVITTHFNHSFICLYILPASHINEDTKANHYIACILHTSRIYASIIERWTGAKYTSTAI